MNRWLARLLIFSLVRVVVPFTGQCEEDVSTDGYARAIALLQEGILFEAIHELEQFTRLNPGNADARLLLARSLRRVQRDEQAAEQLAHIIRLDPENNEARRLLTRLRVEIGQRLDRRDRNAVLRYARLCAIPESYNRSADYYQLALELRDDVSVHLEFARMLSWAGRHAESAYHYERFLKSNPSNADVLFELGRVYNAAGQFDQAAEAFTRCLSVRPDHVRASLDLARALIWSGREDEAEERLRDMQKKKTGGGGPLQLLATIARFQQRVLDEYALLRQVQAMVPDQQEVQARLAVLEQGNLLEEARLLKRLEAVPGDMDARRQLADLYMNAKRFSDALYHLSMIREAQPDDLAVMQRLREVRDQERLRVMAQVSVLRKLRNADRDQEIQRLRQWLEQNAGDMKSRLRLVDLYAEGGQYAEAVAQLEWIAAAAPGNMTIQQTLSRMQLLLDERARQPEDGAANALTAGGS